MKRILAVISLFVFLLPGLYADDQNSINPDLVHLTANSYEFGMDMKSFSANGNVRMTRGTDVITADAISGDLITGDILAQGNVHFESPEESLDGNVFSYNFITKNGIAQNASAKYGALIFSGSEIKANNGVFDVKNSSFTTCNLEKPHYRITAKEVIISPNNELIARGASVHLLGTTLITVPRYKMDLSGDKSSSWLPIILYSQRSGISANYSFDLSSNPTTDFALEVRYATKEDFRGGLHLDRLAGRPIFASLSYKERVITGVDPEGYISKYPEVGFRYYSNPSMRKKSVSRAPIDIARELIGPDMRTASDKNMNTVTEVTAGSYTEYIDSTKRSGQRLDARMLVWYDPHAHDSNIRLYPAAFVRGSVYSNGNGYGVAGLKLAAGKSLGQNAFLSVGYITNATSGKSPFDFDTVELKNELAGSLYLGISDMKLHVNERYDVSAGKTFETNITLSKTLHCVEPSITWHSRQREISFDLRFVGL